MKRSAPMKRTRMKPVSEKRKAANERRAALRADHLRRNPYCRRCVKRKAVHIHEPWLRSRGGPIDDERNFCGLCEGCHTWVHDNPREAQRRGFLVSKYDGPAWLEAGGFKR